MASGGQPHAVRRASATGSRSPTATRPSSTTGVIEDGQVRKEAGYTTDLWTERGVKFIEQNKERPFFLFLAYNGPYSLGGLMRNRSKPPRGVLRRQGAAQLSPRRDAPLAECEQAVPQQLDRDAPRRGRDQRRRRRRRRGDGNAQAARPRRQHAGRLCGRPGLDGGPERHVGHG